MGLLVTEQRPSAAMSPQNPRRKRRIKTSQRKYGLFFLMIFMMITAVKVYLNYANIQQNITDVRAKIVQRKKDMQYLEIQNAYYSSPYAEKIMAHQQGILLEWEQFVLFEHVSPQSEAEIAVTATGAEATGELQVASTWTSLSPFASRKSFFSQKWESIP